MHVFGALCMTLRAPGPNCRPSNYFQGISLTLKVWLRSAQGVKSYFTFKWSQTDTQANIPCTPVEEFFLSIFYALGDGKLQTPQNVYRFTS